MFVSRWLGKVRGNIIIFFEERALKRPKIYWALDHQQRHHPELF